MRAGALFIPPFFPLAPGARAEEPFAQTVVFRETGFPAADAPAPPALESILPGARFATADELSPAN